MNVATYLKETTGNRVRSRIECADGFSLSVQASEMHYCSPRQNEGPWDSVELGFPSEVEEMLLDYAESPEAPTETVYGHVPLELVEALVEKHGGIKS